MDFDVAAGQDDVSVCTITAPILAATPLGSKAAITASASDSPWTDTQLQKYSVTVVPGAVMAGGALAIQRVEPSTGVGITGGAERRGGNGVAEEGGIEIHYDHAARQGLRPGERELDLHRGAGRREFV